MDLEREDLATFLNAALTATGQAEFYGGAEQQRLSVAFLHEYICYNYRPLYALCLAAGINHFNRAWLVMQLLAAGAPADPRQRALEGQLIAATLRELPPQRVYRLFLELRRRNINNRRTRACFSAWLSHRELAFDAVKYRGKLRGLTQFTHTRLPPELGDFLFKGHDSRPRWSTPLLEKVREAHYRKSALFELPFTLAEGFAPRFKLSRKALLEGFEGRLTAAERLRLDRSAKRQGAELDALDLGRTPLTRLCLYLLSMPLKEREQRREELDLALRGSARRALRRSPLRLGRVALVLDRSTSSSGSVEKKRRPLAVALGAWALLREACEDLHVFWTCPTEDPLLVQAKGQTDLAGPLLEGLALRPELVLLVSDGFENDPPGATAQLMRAWRQHLDPQRAVTVVQLNPVFDGQRLLNRGLGPDIATVGVRDAEDLPTALGFARYVDGATQLSQLQGWLEQRAQDLLSRLGVPEEGP